MDGAACRVAELKDALATPASVPTVWRAVRALGLIAWHAAAPTWDVAHLVFLDETGITTNLLRRYGRAPRGARVYLGVVVEVAGASRGAAPR